jgi:protein-S-isoprenylcysteine O-methyltransferase Ste14
METDSAKLRLEEQPDRPFIMLHYLLNLGVAGIWGGLLYLTWPKWNDPVLSWKNLYLLTWVLRNSSLPILFLIRRPAKATSRNAWEWLVAFVGTFIAFGYSGDSIFSLFNTNGAGIIYVFLALSMVFVIIALWSLGRSFGIVPADRGLKTTGSYRVVRHPIYACYIIFDLLSLSLRLSWNNTLIFLIFVSATYIRARQEERLLRRDPAYQEYAGRTRCMFIPSLL